MASGQNVSRDRKILDAAAKLFYERGFDAVGVDEIGEQAGVTGPAIYRHFSSKDEILATLLDEGMDGLLAVTAGSFDDPMEELRHRIEAHGKYVLDERRLASVLFREDRSLALPFRRRLHRRARDYLEGWVDCLRRCFPDRTDDDLTAMVHAMHGMLNSIAHWPPDALEAEDIPQLLSSLIREGVGSAGADRRSAGTRPVQVQA